MASTIGRVMPIMSRGWNIGSNLLVFRRIDSRAPLLVVDCTYTPGQKILVHHTTATAAQQARAEPPQDGGRVL
jgi:hypothetical protein